MRRLALGVCAVALAGILAGCGGGSETAKAVPELTVSYEVTQDTRMTQIGVDVQGNAEYVLEDYYELAGVVTNPSDIAARLVQAAITVRSPSGEILHEETIGVGEVAAGGERSFEYRWYSAEEALFDVRTLLGEEPADGD